jgi:hypothetical protein
MERQEETFQKEMAWGESVTVGDVTVTPQSQARILRWPWVGWVWNRPIAVLVERGGQSERIPIVDVTRLVQVGLLGLGLAFFIVALARSAGKKEA